MKINPIVLLILLAAAAVIGGGFIAAIALSSQELISDYCADINE